MSCGIQEGAPVEFVYEFVDCDGGIEDVSGASLIEFVFENPEGESFTRVGRFDSTGVDGRVKYQAANGEISPSGRWKMQVFLTFPDGKKFPGDVIRFSVRENIGVG